MERRISFARKTTTGVAEQLTLADGYRTDLWVYEPVEASQGLPVVYLHGIQSHPGWWSGSATAMADAGYAVYQPVRRGSGAATIDRGHARSAGQLLDDVQVACEFAMQRCGADKVHLLGVSWGGKLAACYAADKSRRQTLASLTMVTPGIAARLDVPLATKFAIAWALLVHPRSLFDIPLNDVELFTDNPRMRDYLRSDACRLDKASASFLYASRNLDWLVRRSPDGCVDLPTALILSNRDRIIDSDAAEASIRRITAADPHVVRLDGAHTLEFEQDPQPLYDALIAALNRKM